MKINTLHCIYLNKWRWYHIAKKAFTAGAKPIPVGLFNDACGSLLCGFATMDLDEDTRCGTSCEKVNEYRREVRERRCFSAVGIKATGQYWTKFWTSGRRDRQYFVDLSQVAFSRTICMTISRLHRWKGKREKEKAALSIELLISGDWIGRILSGVMMTGIVRHFAYRDLIYAITACYLSLCPNCFVFWYNGVQRWNNAK